MPSNNWIFELGYWASNVCRCSSALSFFRCYQSNGHTFEFIVFLGNTNIVQAILSTSAIRGPSKIWFRFKLLFLKRAIPGLFFFIFRLFNTQLIVYNNCSILINFCRWLDSNRGPLVSEATALPTEPQPLPKSINVTFWLKMHYCLFQKVMWLFWPIRFYYFMLC